LAVVEDKLISNPYYEPPELLAQPSEAARAEWMMTQLVRWAEDREELRRSHDRLSALIENATDGITVVDAEGRILYEGPSAVHLGYKAEDMVGRSSMDFLSPEDAGVRSDPGQGDDPAHAGQRGCRIETQRWQNLRSGGAAELLGIRPSTLGTRIKKLGLK
jgi:PAS domain-containing protein